MVGNDNVRVKGTSGGMEGCSIGRKIGGRKKGTKVLKGKTTGGKGPEKKTRLRGSTIPPFRLLLLLL